MCEAVAVRWGEVVRRGEVRLGEVRRRGEVEVDEMVCASSIVGNQSVVIVCFVCWGSVADLLCAPARSE